MAPSFVEMAEIQRQKRPHPDQVGFRPAGDQVPTESVDTLPVSGLTMEQAEVQPKADVLWGHLIGLLQDLQGLGGTSLLAEDGGKINLRECKVWIFRNQRSKVTGGFGHVSLIIQTHSE